MLYFKGMPNSIDFYKRIFLYVIPAYIIVLSNKEHPPIKSHDPLVIWSCKIT